jgi:hypothetical protein
MRFLAGAFIVLLTACWLLPAQSSKKSAPQPPARSVVAPEVKPEPILEAAPPSEKLTFGVEWHLSHAGTVTVNTREKQIELRIESAGIVSMLYKVDDLLTVNYDEPDCAASSLLESMESKRHHETRVTYDRSQNYAFFVERDLMSDMVIREAKTQIPNCVSDVLGALAKLRTLKLDPGQSAQLPVSDGRKFASVKVDALDRSEVKTAGATYRTVRYQAALLNGVIYGRKGRLFVWVTDDARRLPVQIQVQMSFPVGTVTLQLQKEEHT